MIKAVIFDMDGVIVDTEPINARINHITLKTLNREAPKDYFYQFVGSSLPRLVEQTNQDFNLSVTVEEWREIAGCLKREIIKNEGYPAVPHVTDWIGTLYREGYPLAVASNSPLSDIQDVLIHFDILKYFASMISGLSVPHPKPAPDIFLKAADELDVPPNECLVFEDSYYGSIAAKKAGMFCIGYCNPNSGNQDLSGADFCIDSFKALDVTELISM